MNMFCTPYCMNILHLTAWEQTLDIPESIRVYEMIKTERATGGQPVHYRQCITEKSLVHYRQCDTDFNFLRGVHIPALLCYRYQY